jgi:hypothetical protein
LQVGVQGGLFFIESRLAADPRCWADAGAGIGARRGSPLASQRPNDNGQHDNAHPIPRRARSRARGASEHAGCLARSAFAERHCVAHESTPWRCTAAGARSSASAIGRSSDHVEGRCPEHAIAPRGNTGLASCLRSRAHGIMPAVACCTRTDGITATQRMRAVAAARPNKRMQLTGRGVVGVRASRASLH